MIERFFIILIFIISILLDIGLSITTFLAFKTKDIFIKIAMSSMFIIVLTITVFIVIALL